MTTDTYNGWTNYETWAFALWMDNNREAHKNNQAMRVDYENDAEGLTQALKSMYDNDSFYPVFEMADGTFYADLTLSNVDWVGIAHHLLEA